MTTSNPFQAPAARLTDFESAPPAAPSRLAGRLRRFGANLVDSTLVYSALGLLITALMTDLRHNLFMLYGLLGAITLAVLLIQAGLYRNSGQSIGKKIFSIRTVRRDGRPASLARVFFARNGIPFLLGWIPVLGLLFVLTDALLIFRRDRRTLHDLFADTIVVYAG